jgi:hypothetical protein
LPVHCHPATAFNPTEKESVLRTRGQSATYWIGISWTRRLKSSHNKAPNLLDAAIIHWIGCIPWKIPTQKSHHINSAGDREGMTTDRQMAMMYADQEAVITALHAIGDHDLADRLERCAAVRRERRHGDGWPRVCRSLACAWCRRPMIRAWWFGMSGWTAEATMWSLAVIPLHPSAGLSDAVRRLRRGLRDVRDRRARQSRRWRDVCCAGMIGGDHAALVMIIHEAIDRHEVQDVLHHRWPDVVVKSLEREEPAVAMSPVDAADLGRCRRGIEPLRIVIMPQGDRQVAAPMIEPMPVLV